MKNFKRIAALILAAMMIMSLAACGATATTGTKAEETKAEETKAEETKAEETKAEETEGEKTYEPTTLTFWNGFTSTDGEVLQDIVDKFNESNEYGITIEMDVMPWATFNEKLPAAIATGDAPDFVLCSSGYYPAYTNAGSFQDVSDFYDLPTVNKEDFEENVVNMLYYDGVCIGIPMQMVTHYLFWDKDLYEAAGLDPEKAPETWEEVMANAELLTDKSKNQYGFCMPANANVPAQYTMYAHGGNYTDDTETIAMLNSPENVEAFEDIVKLYECSPKDTDDNTYICGQLGQFVNGPWIINGLRENEINFGVCAVPACEGVDPNAAVIPVGFSIPITTSEEHKELVYKFVEHWNSEEICTRWTAECGTPAYLKSAEANFADDPLTSALSVPLAYGGIVCKRTGVSQIASDALYPAMGEIFEGADIQETLDKYNPAAQAVLDQ